MARAALRSCHTAAGALITGMLLAAAVAPAQESCASAACHAGLMTKATVHQATESCDVCHEPLTSTHPQPGQRTFQLAMDPPELCGNCHDLPGQASQVHVPVAEGVCLACHDPHASAQQKLLIRPLGELCQECHTDHLGSRVLHGPVSAGECTACHSPHESELSALLLKPADEICFDCHQDLHRILEKAEVHPAIEEGCTSCHQPHGSAQAKLLIEEGAALCFNCHDGIGEKVESSAVVHAAAIGEKGCANCHSPHAADNPRLLVENELATCTSCHPSVIGRDRTILHGPIADGQCTPCHDPHGSANEKLLAESFPATDYVPYTGQEFALCFDCHDRDLVRYPDTSFATGFRDGERNLHFLHVSDERKGRSCVLCHDVHGAGNRALIAPSVPFGNWQLPLKFEQTETGGGCSPGCHRPLSYDRERPAASGQP